METINNIKEKRVNFDNAKLLKEIGFDVPCHRNFEIALKSKKDKQDGYSGSFGWKKGEFNIQEGYNTNSSLNTYYDNINWYGCSAPTQQIALDWIRINFGIDVQIIVNYSSLGKLYRVGVVFINVLNQVDTLFIRPDNDTIHFIEFKTPEEAREAAIKHVLTNMIS